METVHVLVASLDNKTKSRGRPEKPNLEKPLLTPVLPPPEEPLPDPPLPPPPYNPQLYPPLPLDGNEAAAMQGANLPSPSSAHRIRDRVPSMQLLPPIPVEAPSSTTILPVHTVRPMVEGGPLVFQYWPFTSSNLYNWKHQNSPFSEQPQKLIDLVKSIFITHSPTWDDCQQLLHRLFTSEEHDRIITEGKKLVLGDDGRPTTDPACLAVAFSTERPDWNFATDQGREHLQSYCQTLLAGLQAAAHKPTNLARIDSVRQGPDEIPATFLEWLQEAFRIYSPVDPTAPNSQTAVLLAFVSKSIPDIHRKLQRADAFMAQSLTELLKVAEKVFNSHKTPEERADRLRQEDIARQEQRQKEVKE
uniref:YLP motif-containing protein 1-like n=1 Tax=Monodelphis domestica TaxID=13616 RepID=A0A5F8H8V4_MONDO